MTDDWRKAAQNLTDTEREAALKNLLESASEPEAGIIRQILGDEKKPLTEKQQYVYDKHIEESLVEKCGNKNCGSFVPAGVNYCPTCEIEYGG